MIHGMTLRHHRGHFVRAAIEGVAFALLRTAQPIEDIRTQAPEKVYLTGGLSTSTLWRQTVANVFGAPIVVPLSPESSARGAAILAWMALGMAGSYAQFAQPETLLPPDPELHNLYRGRFDAFCRVNARLSSSEHPHESHKESQP
jgi:gluconokinase